MKSSLWQPIPSRWSRRHWSKLERKERKLQLAAVQSSTFSNQHRDCQSSSSTPIIPSYSSCETWRLERFFFKEELSKSVATLRSPVILKLEDFNMKLKREAVDHIVDFIYKGEINIPANLLSPVCEAAHNLGVYDLIDFLPAPAKKTTPPTVQESGTQIDDESFANSSTNG